MSRSNRARIHEYVTVILAMLEPKTGGVINLSAIIAQGNKPGSQTPLTERALRLAAHPDNTRTAMILGPAIGMMPELAPDAYQGLRHAIDDPTMPGRHPDQANAEEKQVQAQYAQALSYLTRYVERWHDGAELHVAYDPEDEPAASKTEAHNIKRRYTAEDAYRNLAALVACEVERGGTKSEAVKAVASKSDTSERKVWRACASDTRSANIR